MRAQVGLYCLQHRATAKAKSERRLIDSWLGGSTNGGDGIQLAYSVSEKAFKKDGINRVILATDGDFNVGVTGQGQLVRLIEEKRRSGVFLTVLGVGEGNLKDSTMEKLADKGNGNYAYLDSLNEARKVLVQQAGGTLVTVAKDVKIQVEFNPAQVQSYRLIGYENRVLNHQDFKDDTKDAGDMGAGHTVTALYEVVPNGSKKPAGTEVDPLKYQKTTLSDNQTSEWLTLKLRYKAPNGETSSELSSVYTPKTPNSTSPNTMFAAAITEFGLLLRESRYKGTSNYDHILTTLNELDKAGMPDPQGYRAELKELVNTAKRLSTPTKEVVR